MNCKCCFEDYICKCVPYGSTITLNSFLTPLHEYTYVITDKFANKYTGTAISDNLGHLEINTADVPEGFFTEFSGHFKLEIMDSDKCTPINFLMVGEYGCVEFDVVGGTTDKDFLGCEIPDVSISGGGE